MEGNLHKTVCIVILNWNGLADTVECVRSCLKLDYPAFTIVVVDNGSEDGSEATLRQEFPALEVLQSGANLGFAGGNNVGIRFALKRKADYIWLINNDTVVDPWALAELVMVLERDTSIGMAGSKILSFAEPSLLFYAGGVLDPDLGYSCHIGYGEKDDHRYDQALDTGYITGCSLLVRASVLQEIGLMDEAYFLYFEESEWCLKARRHGLRLAYVPGSVVYHKESVSTRKIGGSLAYYLTRNRLFFIRRNATRPQWLKRLLLDLGEMLRCSVKMDFVQVGSMLAAYRHYLAGYCGRRDAPLKMSAFRRPGPA